MLKTLRRYIGLSFNNLRSQAFPVAIQPRSADGAADQMYTSVKNHAEKKYQKTVCNISRRKRYWARVAVGEVAVLVPIEV